MKHLIKYTSVILLVALAVASFQSCNKQEPIKPSPEGTPLPHPDMQCRVLIIR